MKDSLPCLWLPLEEKNAILPSAAIAEIIPFEKPTEIPDVPAWFLGVSNWRGIHIPLTCLEKMESHLIWDTKEKNNKKEEAENPFSYIAVINRIYKVPIEETKDGIKKYPFFAIALEKVAKLQRLAPDNMKLVAKLPDEDPRFLMQVKILNDFAYIPNLQKCWAVIDALPSRLQWFRQIVL